MAKLSQLKRQNILPIIGEPIHADLEGFAVFTLPTITKNGRTYGEILHTSDSHYGHRNQRRSFLQRHLYLLKQNPWMRWSHGGDIFEMQLERQTRFLTEATCREKDQIQMFLDDFKPVASQGLFIIPGNHDLRFANAVSEAIDLFKYLKMELGNRKLVTTPPGRGLLCAFKVGNQIYSSYQLHGASNAAVNTMAQLRRARGHWDVDYLAMGHTHKMAWEPYTVYTVAKVGGRLCRLIKHQYLLNTGSFVAYPSYAEQKSLPLNDLGAPIVRLYADYPGIEYIDPRVHYRKILYQNNGEIHIEAEEIA